MKIWLTAAACCAVALAPVAPVARTTQAPREPGQIFHERIEIEPDPWQRRAVAEKRHLRWDHWGLELYRSAADRHAGLMRLEFCLKLKPGVERAWTSVGYPRYRTTSGRWHEATIDGLPGSRVVTASTDSSPESCFDVVVSEDVAELRLAVGETALNIAVAPFSHPTPPPPSAAGESAPPTVAGGDARLPAPGTPVRLEASLLWDGNKPFGDGALDADESGELLVEVVNRGERAAGGILVVPRADRTSHLLLPESVSVPTIQPGASRIVRVPVGADAELTDATLMLTLEIQEPFGHDAAPLELEVVTRSAPLPALMLTDDFLVEGNRLPVPRDTIVTVHLRVRNEGQGAARDVVAEVSTGEGVYPAHDTEERFELGDLRPGEVGELVYRCYANQHAEQLALRVELRHARAGSSSTSSLVTLPLAESSSVARIVRVQPDPPPERTLAPPPMPLTSDVDRFVPHSDSRRPDALAVVLGVEEYLQAPAATYSAEDARTAARYFEHALGIPAQRIQLLLNEDVTLGQLHRIFGRDGWLARRVDHETEVFVFFAGHGVSSTDAFDPYLIPADGDLNYIRQTGFPLDLLIDSLAALGARSSMVFLDACFSGITRDGRTLFEGSRPLVISPVREQLAGVSVFSAAKGTQIAGSLDEQGHGLFSYYLFKGLGGAADLDRDSRIHAGELRLYLEETVPRAAADLDREQTPSIFLAGDDPVLVELP
jgi:hypothetical protein